MMRLPLSASTDATPEMDCKSSLHCLEAIKYGAMTGSNLKTAAVIAEKLVTLTNGRGRRGTRHFAKLDDDAGVKGAIFPLLRFPLFFSISKGREVSCRFGETNIFSYFMTS